MAARVGSTSASLSDAFGGGAYRWLAGPSISWDFPNILATRARIEGARADARADLASFDGTVLTALQETETALSAYAHEIDRHQALWRRVTKPSARPRPAWIARGKARSTS